MPLEQILNSKKTLLIGIGGGGDIIGTIPTARFLKQQGIQVEIAGITWKRKSHDPLGRPRPREHFTKTGPGNEIIWQVKPEAKIKQDAPHPEAKTHIENTLAKYAPYNISTVNVTDGAQTVKQGLQDYAKQNNIDQIIGIDVGGDVFCYGNEKTLRSPMCDQIMLAALAQIEKTILGIIGLGTDGEITLQRFGERFQSVRQGYIGTLGLTDEDITYLSNILNNQDVKTECSRLLLATAKKYSLEERQKIEQQLTNFPIAAITEARADYTPLREGTRTGELSRITPHTMFFKPKIVYETSDFSTYINDAGNVDNIRKEMNKRGLITELDTQD